MSTFIDFWLLPVIPSHDLIDHRAVAEQELADFLAGLDPATTGRPLVYLNGDSDWLADGIPPEWIADMLATLAKYPAADYTLCSVSTPYWQQRMKAVAALDGPGALIARAWLDGFPPAGLHLRGPSTHQRLLAAIPQPPPRPYEPGRLEPTS